MPGLVSKLLGNRLHLSAVGVATVLVVSVAYLFAGVLQTPLTSRPAQVTVRLAGTGGLFEGSAVTYRGVKVGRVTGIDLTATGAEATVRLIAGAEVPASSRARVRSLSPVGEQYLDFQPPSPKGPFLHDGSTIEASATDLPTSLGSTVVAVNNVLRQIDDRKLHALLGELSTGLSGSGDDIGRIVDQGDLILAELDKAWPQTDSLLTGAGPALSIATDSSADLRRLAANASTLARFLKGYDPELMATLQRSPRRFEQIRQLVVEWGKVLPGFFPVAAEFTRIFATHDPHLRQILSGYAHGIDVLSGVLGGGKLRLTLIAAKDARCRYGTAHRDPRSTERREVVKDAGCSAEHPRLQRGEQHRPGPVPAP